MWSASPYFQSGIVNYVSSSGSAYNLTILSLTYNSALTGPPTKMPIISIYNLNYQITATNLAFEFLALNWTTTGMQI